MRVHQHTCVNCVRSKNRASYEQAHMTGMNKIGSYNCLFTLQELKLNGRKIHNGPQPTMALSSQF